MCLSKTFKHSKKKDKIDDTTVMVQMKIKNDCKNRSFDKHHHKKEPQEKNVEELFVIVMPALKLLSV